MKLGDAFTLPNEYGVRHLHVIISDPAQSSDQVFHVMVSTRGDHKEECCILRSNDHPFITHDSVIVYKIPPARLVTLQKLNQLKEQNILKERQSVSPELLKRIQEGYAKSRFWADRIYQLWFRQGLIE